MAKVILYIATSLDDFIADQQGSINWLPHPDDPKDTLDYHKLMHRISTIVIGRRSYERIINFGDWAWPNKRSYVFSSQVLSIDHNSIIGTQQSPHAWMKELKKQAIQNDIWLLGDAELAHSFAKEQLIDECIITAIPTTLGTNIKLNLPDNNFH